MSFAWRPKLPFGSLVTTLSADLTQLDRDLAAATKKWEDYSRRVAQLVHDSNIRVARGRGPGAGTGALGDPVAEAQRAARVQHALTTQRLREELETAQKLAATNHALANQRIEEEKRVARAKLEADQRAAASAHALANQRIREEERVQARLDAIARQQAQNRFRFLGDQARAAEAARRREEGFRTTETIGDLRGKISGLGERPISVSAADPQAVSKLAAQFAEANSSAARFGRTIDGIVRRDIHNLNQNIDYFVKRLQFIGTAAVLGGLTALVKRGFELNLEWERYRLALSASLALTHDVVTEQGKLVTGARAISFIGRESEKLFKILRKEANETILETNELIQVFTENVGNAARAGLTVDQFKPIASNVAQLAKAIGLPGGAAQASQEIRAILEGQNLRNATIAKTIGLTTESINKAKEEGRLFEFLMSKFKDAQPIIDDFAKSATALWSSLVSKGQDFIRLSFEKVFERARISMKELNSEVTDSKIEEIAGRFADAMVRGLDAMRDFAKSDAWGKFTTLFNLIIKSPLALAGLSRALIPILGLAGVPGLNVATVGATAAFAGVAFGQAATRMPDQENILNPAAQRRFQASQAVRNARAELLAAQQAMVAGAGGGPGVGGRGLPVDPRRQENLEREVAVRRSLLAKRLAEQEEIEFENRSNRLLQKAAADFQRSNELQLRAKKNDERVLDARKKELAEVQKIEAQAAGDRVALLRAEAAEAIAQAEKEIKNSDLKARAIAAINAKYRRQERLEQAKERNQIDLLRAEASGSLRRQLTAQAVREQLESRSGEILPPEELRLRDRAAVRNAERQYREAQHQANVKIRDATVRGNEVINDTIRKRVQLHRDLENLERDGARQARALAKERLEAERALTRALEDQRRVREDIAFSAGDRARRDEIRGALTEGTRAPTAPRFLHFAPEQADVEATNTRNEIAIRRAAGRIQAGEDVDKVTADLESEGFAVGSGLRFRLRQLQNKQSAAGLAREKQVEGRAPVDEARALEEAGTRVLAQELQVGENIKRQQELNESLAAAAKTLNENFNNAVRDAGKQLRDVVKAIVETMQQAGVQEVSLDPNIARAGANLVRRAGGGISLGGAGGALGGGVNITLNIDGTSVTTTSDANIRKLVQRIMPAVKEYAEEEGRRVAPRK